MPPGWSPNCWKRDGRWRRKGARSTVVFGNPTSPPGAGAPWHTVPFARVLRYLEDHLSAHWGMLGRTQIKDDTLALLALREKAHRAATGAPYRGHDR